MFRHSCNYPYYFDDSDYENNGYGRCGRDRGCPGSFEPYNCCRPGPIGPRGCPGPIGPVGPTGAAGLDGLDGATGPTGPAAIVTAAAPVADATSAEDVVERFNELLANLRAAGLLATDNA